MSQISAPPPKLLIVPTDAVHAHEAHDSQRSEPLIETLKAATVMKNPPIVTHIDDHQYMVMDGANRCFSFSALAYPHILVQVTSYQSGYVQLHTWNHVIGHWDIESLLTQWRRLSDLQLHEGQQQEAIAHLITRDGTVFGLRSPLQTTHERNEVLREVVHTYQRNARLNRTALNEPEDAWGLFPDAIGLVVFPGLEPKDIINAARYHAYLPPGISRHIVQGRALMVNYPMSRLKDPHTSLEKKNQVLNEWLQEKLATRQIRYYAEATYQFDE